MAEQQEERKVVMVRYGELFLKSDPVKYHFIGILLRNIRWALETAGHSSSIRSPRGRIFVSGEKPEEIAAIIARVFGVVDVSICTLVEASPDALRDAAVALARSHLHPPCRFAVRAKRQTKTGMNSQQLGEHIGSAVYDAIPGLSVDLTHPEYELFAEVRDCGGLVYDKRIPAPGGLPWGSQGKVLSLLSSGIDSPVASWLAMKRGCEVAHLHMDGGRWAGADVRETAIENHRRLSLWCPGADLKMIVADAEPFYDRMQELRVPARLRCVLCKRFMLRVAGTLAGPEGAQAVLTGENLGQVASQTLANLAVIADATTVPVLRPLITYDKGETVTLARKIGTFMEKQGDLACRAVPRMPATAATREAVAESEAELGIDELLGTVLSRVTYITARNGKIL
ncbi:tRNA uracil 4-sulfurtransferase ThiI [Methanoregula sp.]|uniref:tRNA uracil 4-sulfurtransferase ThiI n=1 Tax=Methanoregula sp. TaxID=2052170 RepID=UPI002C35A748|nr:tRNA uracil 4-sulfurtransferase ThiI [Methanoregula sp.]HVP96853.1 tRNA uracil 4-sulfurtransferase ThiI [Methanoregula sp.]